MTAEAIAKVKSILAERTDEAGIRIAIIGGGASGFQYQMTVENEAQEDDRIIDLEGIRVYVDPKSLLYLNGTEIDYVDGGNGSGFKFDSPNARL